MFSGRVLVYAGKRRQRKVVVPVLAVVAALLVLVPVFTQLYILKGNVENVPYADDWGLVGFIREYATDGDWVTLLLSQANENRCPFFRLLAIANYHLYRLDFSVMMMTLWVFEVFIFLLLLRHARNLLPGETTLVYWGMVPVAMTVFNLNQIEYILGFRYLVYMTIFFSLLALYWADKSRRFDGWLVLAAGAGLVASFSWIVGFLVWPIVLGFIVLRRHARLKEKAAAGVFWLVITGVVFLVHYGFIDYSHPVAHPSPVTALAQPQAFIDYFLVNLGFILERESPITQRREGALLLLLFLAVLVFLRAFRPYRVRPMTVGLGLFAIGFSLMTALGRCGFGVEHATQGRYSAFTGLLIVSIIMLLLPAGSCRRNAALGRIKVLRVILLLFALYVAWSVRERNIQARPKCDGYGAHLRENRVLLLNYSALTPEQSARFLVGSHEGFLDLAGFMAEHKLGCFNE